VKQKEFFFVIKSTKLQLFIIVLTDNIETTSSCIQFILLWEKKKCQAYPRVM